MDSDEIQTKAINKMKQVLDEGSQDESEKNENQSSDEDGVIKMDFSNTK